MADYKIFTDSCSDLSMEYINKYDIQVCSLSYILNSITYKNLPDHSELPTEKFFATLKEGAIGATSQVSPNDFIDAFTKYLKKGKDILYIAFSSPLSGTYNSALIAKDYLQEKYPDRKIICIDTLNVSTSQGLLVIKACQNKENGMSIEENAEDIQNNVKYTICHFVVDDLNSLKKGGRLHSSHSLKDLLGMKTIININDDGKLAPITKCRGRKNSFKFVLDLINENILDKENDLLIIAHAFCHVDAEYLKSKLIKELGVKNIEFSYVGPVIGMHTGPGTIMFSYFGKKR